MSQVIPFETGNVPAFIKAAFDSEAGNLANINPADGYPVVSIKGKVFTFKNGDEATLITKPDTDEPASSLEVVILDIGPDADLRYNSRIFYFKKFEEGSTEKPDCYSSDGVAPAADAQHPQAKECAVCEHNAKGTSDTGRGKRCASVKRLAIATPDALDKPMLLRVPGDSLMAFNEYVKWMAKNGIKDSAYVITKIGFDYTVAHPALTFKGLGWATTDPTEAKKSDTVAYITGKKVAPAHDAQPFAQAAPDFATKAAEDTAKAEQAAAPSRSRRIAKPADDLPTEPVADVKVEGSVKQAEPVVQIPSGDLDINELDFDD